MEEENIRLQQELQEVLHECGGQKCDTCGEQVQDLENEEESEGGSLYESKEENEEGSEVSGDKSSFVSHDSFEP